MDSGDKVDFELEEVHEETQEEGPTNFFNWKKKHHIRSTKIQFKGPEEKFDQ
jgi:hypothetical protein